jgi:phosphoglycerate kinase
MIDALLPGQILLLENLRFHLEEEKNDLSFAKQLADLGDLWVFDAFSCAHRAHASTYGIGHFLPIAMGLSMEQELNALAKVLIDPKKPVAALIGGSKISTKLSVLQHLMEKVDYLLIGGAMANGFLLAQGHSIGQSFYEPNMVDLAKNMLDNCGACTIVLPQDAYVAEKLQPYANCLSFDIDAIANEHMMLDIGPKTIASFCSIIEKCKSVLWNGPLGAFEYPPFEQGSIALAKTIAKYTQLGQLTSIAGGGDTLAALSQDDSLFSFSHLSTAGGAFLEFLEGKSLPGIEILLKK